MNLFEIILGAKRSVHILAEDAEDAAWAGIALADRENTFLIDVKPVDETNG